MKPAGAGSKICVNRLYVHPGRGLYVNWHPGAGPGKYPPAFAARGNARGAGKGRGAGSVSELADTASSRTGKRGCQGARRPRQHDGRPYRVHFSLTAEEFAALEDAAGRAGLARGAYAAQVVLDRIHGTGTGPEGPAREALRELVRAAGLVRRIGVNLNQAVAKLNATGQRSGDLLPYAIESLRRAERLDAAAERVRKTFR